MKYKIGDFLKIVNPSPSISSMRYKKLKDKIVIIISTDILLGGVSFDYKIRFVSRNINDIYLVDYYYNDFEVIKVSEKEAVLEVL